MILDLIKRAAQVVYNPNKSGLGANNVQDAIDNAAAENNKTRASLGLSKNLLKTSARPMTSQGKNGITCTYNTDGSITVSGKATADTQMKFLYGPEESYKIAQGNYLLTGCPIGGSENTYHLRVEVIDEYGRIYAKKDTGYGRTISITDDYSMIYSAGIYVASGTELDDVTFYPMISLEGGAYEPYREDKLKNIENHLGINSKNLFYHNIKSSSFMGLISTVNDNKSITYMGVSTGMYNQIIKFDNSNRIYITEDLILSGCPSGGNGKYSLSATVYTNDGHTLTYTDTGNGVTIPLNEVEEYAYIGYVEISIDQGVDCGDGLVFEPMIRLFSELDDTYEAGREDRIKAVEDALTKANLTEIPLTELTQIDGTDNYTVTFARYLVRSGICYVFLGIYVINPFNDRYALILNGLPAAAFDCEVVVDERSDSSNRNSITLLKRGYDDKLCVAFGTNGGSYNSMISYPIA